MKSFGETTADVSQGQECRGFPLLSHTQMGKRLRTSASPLGLLKLSITTSPLTSCSHKTTWLYWCFPSTKEKTKASSPLLPLQQQTLMFTSCLSGCSHHDPIIYDDKAFLVLWFTSPWESATPSFSFSSWNNICSFFSALVSLLMFWLFLHFMTFLPACSALQTAYTLSYYLWVSNILQV